jgi:hypothetical protein
MVTRFLIILSGILLLTFISCNESETVWSGDQNFIPDTIAIFNYFDESEFENDTLPQLLEEIGICSNQSDKSAHQKNLCSPRNYKFFKFNSSLPWRDGFGLEIRATVDGFPLRRFIIFERIDGKLVKTRGFVANLAEMHTTSHGYNDLMLLFPDKEAGSFVVKFVYDHEKRMYEYKSVEAIDGYLVKKERKDSLSNIVVQRLYENNMFF